MLKATGYRALSAHPLGLTQSWARFLAFATRWQLGVNNLQQSLMLSTEHKLVPVHGWDMSAVLI